MILLGDCIERLKELEENSVDAVVTDPPYGWRFMGKAWDGADIKKHADWAGKKEGVASAAGKYSTDRDDNFSFQLFSEKYAKEILRVLKPGAHMLVFCGPRTYHRMASGIEDAGFEIRDQLQWLFGSGFPKSLDISKAIDKAAGAERERYDRPAFGGIFSDDDGTTYGTAIVNTPSTDAAKEWQGWGTALKPANEPIVLARKPLSENTVAANILRWGVGGLNIDASRIKTDPNDPGIRTNPTKDSGHTSMFGMGIDPSGKGPEVQGRWPANLLLDETAAEMLDEQSGLLTKQGSRKLQDCPSEMFAGGSKDSTFYGDSGGASRFFYVAKASKRERNLGLEGMPEVDFSGGGGVAHEKSDVYGARKSGVNFHPTVKPIKLMEYLIRLITPPNGTVLDPFMGSGSTGVAAKRLGFEFIGIEMDPSYAEIARKRLEHAAKAGGET